MPAYGPPQTFMWLSTGIERQTTVTGHRTPTTGGLTPATSAPKPETQEQKIATRLEATSTRTPRRTGPEPSGTAWEVRVIVSTRETTAMPRPLTASCQPSIERTSCWTVSRERTSALPASRNFSERS